MRRPLFTACLCLVTVIAIGKILTGADTGRTRALPPDKSPVRVTGRIDTRTSEEIILDVISLIQNDQPYSYSGKLQCELTNSRDSEMDIPELKIGQQIVLEGTFSRFASASNPGEFDAQAYYMGKGISGRVQEVRLLAAGTDYSFWQETLYSFRRILHDRLAQVFPEKEASVMQTLLLGEKEELDEEVKALYQKNGIAHILSISGLHITLLGMGCYRLLKRSGVPVKAAATGGAAVLVVYGMMVGMSVSASRAIGMYLLQMLGLIVGRTYDMLTGLGLLAVLLVLQEPERLGDVGFLMSFGAVSGICVLTPVLSGGKDGTEQNAMEPEAVSDYRRDSRMPAWLWNMRDFLGNSDYARNKYREGWRKAFYEGSHRGMTAIKNGFTASAGVILFTLPVQLCFFYEIPVYSVLLNLLVLPLMSVVMAGGILSLVPGLGIAGTVDCLVLWWYEWICERFGELPGAVWNVGQPKLWQIVCYYGGIFVVAALREIPGMAGSAGRWRRLFRRRATAWLFCGLLVILLTGKADQNSRVIFLDVGQGDSIVVETAQGAYLFDCGSTSRKKIGEYVLRTYLKSRGIRTLRGVFVSHPDEDHINGVLELLENNGEWGIAVENLFLPAIYEAGREDAFGRLLAAAENTGTAVHYIKCGDEIRERQLRLLCLHPEENTMSTDTNAYSECFYVEVFAKGSGQNRGTGEGVSILLTGDVEGEGEQQLVQELENRDLGQIDLFKVAHHGSGYTNNVELLAAAQPATAIISCGRNNSYGHPHAETLQRLEEAGISWYTTMDHGALTVIIRRDGSSRLYF